MSSAVKSIKLGFHKKTQKQRLVVLRRLSRRALFKNPSVAHGISHQENALRSVRWYAKLTGMAPSETHNAELAAIVHDIEKSKPNHAVVGAETIRHILKGHVPKEDLELIVTAIERHSNPFIEAGRRVKSNPVADALFFADRVEGLGPYGSFRMLVHAVETSLNRPNDSIDIKKFFIDDMAEQIRINTNVGFKENNVPLENYYSNPNVVHVLKELRESGREFSRALNSNEPWALEVFNYLTLAVKRNRGKKITLTTLIKRFRPHDRKAREFKAHAINYIE